MKTRSIHTRSHGSALLIVLGFLSFMMISAVSFAIYMRIERQASSNYRHTVEARHILNTALCRAIEEVDSDLRDQSNISTNKEYKFPAYWRHRIRTSSVEDEENNEQDARVLSMEALSFVPGILVNEVRRYAVRDEDVDDDWMGAKWRELSMPVPSLGDESGRTLSADGQAVIGRYAYVCINVSDMLNVNDCTNRIGISQLFNTADSDPVGKAEAFVDKYINTDYRYDTLQDFYACMQQRRGHDRSSLSSVRKALDNTPFGSPYHLWQGSSSGGDAGYSYADKQVLVTDGMAKPEPVNTGSGCNILTTQPVVLGNDPYEQVKLQHDFLTALQLALPSNHRPSSSDTYMTDTTMGTLIADYLDEDSIPRQLNMPSVEMVPMISQIVIDNTANAGFQPKFIVEPDNSTTPPTEKRSIKLIGNATAGGSVDLSVEVVWPFRTFKKQLALLGSHSYTLNAVLCFKVVRNETLKTMCDWTACNIKLTDPTGSEINDCSEVNINNNVNSCYQDVRLTFKIPASTTIEIPLVAAGTAVSGYALSDNISVACAMLVQVIQDGSVIVDQVPCMRVANRTGDQTTSWLSETPKLYFQTEAAVLSSAANNQYLSYKKNSLEIADPRFNYRAGDWVASSTTDSTVDEKINSSTTAILGQDGRDSDIFMSVANTKTMQSPGELGFILRPFAYDDGSGDANDLMSQTAISSVPDYNAMFRTVRLYDHGDPNELVNRAHDLVYDYFYTETTDGTVSGSRVNPLSNIPLVLQSAIYDTPYDYFIVAQKKSDQTDYRFNRINWDSSWPTFADAWAGSFVSNSVQTRLNAGISYTDRLASFYGDWDKFEWYSDYSSDPSRKKIFKTTLNHSLYEIDRKMLFSYSLENFCDRQQLFLYILRAEKTGQRLGSDAENGTRSLAGGRAVALVWRDPYPSGLKCRVDSDYDSDRMAYWSDYPDGQPATPWRQYHINDSTIGNVSVKRRQDLHEHRILFFKQLDN